MPRYARMLISDEKAIYHVMSRTALDGFPFKAAEKDEIVKIIQKFSRVYFTKILGYCIMDNHFHVVVKMLPGDLFSDEDIKERYARRYGEERIISEDQIPHFREKWSSLSSFIQEIKQTISVYYNKRHDRRGTLWGERFKSVIVEKGETLINLLAYLELNAVRACLVDSPEDYRWCSLGYHAQRKNRDNFLSLDFGLKEFGQMNDGERFRLYRKFVYETGATDRGKGVVMAPELLEDEREKNFVFTRTKRFKYRTRYFTDSGIIGSKEFVRTNYLRFRDYLQSKKDKQPKPINGLAGIYSLKKL